MTSLFLKVGLTREVFQDWGTCPVLEAQIDAPPLLYMENLHTLYRQGMLKCTLALL